MARKRETGEFRSIHLRLPATVLEEVERTAARNRRTTTAQIRLAIERDLERAQEAPDSE